MEYKENICPLLFMNSHIDALRLYDLIDTFYKRSILSFSNETYTNLNSNINYVVLYNVANINLDLNDGLKK